MSDRLRVSLNLVLPVAQIAAAMTMFGSGDFEALSADGPVPAARDPATPAGYAFVIWFAIYALSIAYGVLQALPSRRRDPLHRRIGWLTAFTFAACALWLVVARIGPAFLTAPILIAMFVAIATAFLRAVRTGFGTRADRTVTAPLLGLYAGWLTAASVLNVTNVAPEYGVSIFGLSPAGIGLLSVAAATTIGAGLTVAGRGQPFYAGTLVWAFTGIVAGNLGETGVATVAVAAAVALAAVVGLTAAVRGSARPRTEALSA